MSLGHLLVQRVGKFNFGQKTFPQNMRILYCKTLWGVTAEMGNAPGGYAKLFARLAADGFNAIETPIWKIDSPKEFREALDSVGMEYVAMVNTCTWSPSNGVGEVNSAPSQKLPDHLASLEEQVELSKALRPILINSHSGCDLWDLDTSRAFFAHALALETKTGIKMCHETHRGRILYNPWITRQLCRDFPALKLTSDLSHFCCVAERVFPDTDEDWKTVMVEIVRATHHIHARVG